MAQLKHIQRLFEHSNDVKILSIDDYKVTFINPDGEQVVVDMYPDGDWEDWIDPPYVKSVSISGDDGKYKYSMSAETDEEGTYLEIDNYDLNVESLEDIEKRKKQAAIKAEFRRKQQEEENQKRREQWLKDVEASGLSESDYSKEKRLQELLNNPILKQKNKEVDPDSLFKLAKIEHYYYDEKGRVEDVDHTYIKIPINAVGDIDPSDQEYDQMADMLGLGTSDDEIMELLKEKGFLRKRDKYIGLINPPKEDPRKYAKRAPFFSDLSYFFKDKF